jgi:hypothetical protein
MTDAAVTARYAALELVTKQLEEIELSTTSTGAYNVDAGTKWLGGLENHLKELYVPGGSSNNDGALQICNAGTDLANIKSTDMHTAATVLKLFKDMAAAKTAADPTQQVYSPEITVRADANDEAERLNTRAQFIIGVKEAISKVATKRFGKNITDPVLRNADGSDFKSINDWTVKELLEAIRQGADRPTNEDTFAKALQVFRTDFNFQSKIQTNYDSLNAKAGQLKHFGITIGPSILGFLLFRQVEQASTYEWGRDLRPAIQTIRQKYHYNHVHDTVSIAEMLSLFAGADAVRNLSQAPSKLPESALAVDLVAQLLGEHEVYSDDDTTEQASAASAESGTSRRPRQRKEKDGKRGRGRSSSRYRGRSRGRDRSRSESLECPHCEKHGVRARHFGIPPEKCFLNPKRKGWRPEFHCRKLGIDYVEKKHFEDKEEKKDRK